jgi:hypothetical protein
VCLLVFLVGVSSTIIAQDEPTQERQVPEMRATKINPHAPTIDGRLDDVIWDKALKSAVRDFTQRDPDDGAAPTESTVVAMVYDQDAIYFAFWCYDSEPEKIDRQLVRRDRWSESDYIIVRLDPHHDHQTGNGFVVTAAGVERDCRYYNEDHSDYDWDAVWEGQAQVHSWGWSAEMRIPYHCLRFTEADEHTWGMDFARYVNRKSEAVRWSYTPISEGGLVSNWGHLTDLTDIAPARHLEVMPYTVARASTMPSSLSNPDGHDTFASMGVDIKYGLTSNLTLDATFNPDFGQVELDRPVLNLSTYETWRSEKRPFFLEGANMFNTEFSLFYSRRIGRSPYNDVNDDDLDYYTDYPDGTTIIGAGKLSGKLAGGTSIAVLTAVTEEESARYVTEAGLERDGVVEPQGSYSVLRIKQDIFERSNVGAILTIASQDKYHPEVTGGLDWRLFTNNGRWLARGQAIFSSTEDTQNGYGFDLTLEKANGKWVRGAVGFTLKDPHLDINKLGYTGRVNSKQVWSWVQLRTSDDIWIVRNSWNNFNFHSSWNYDGTRYSLGGNFNSYMEFKNNWSLGGGFSVQGERYSDDETRGNGLWEWVDHPTYNWWFSLHTDQREMISFNLNPGAGTDRGGTWWANYVGVEFRPRSDMEFDLGVNYTRNRDCLYWVENIEDSSLFAELDKDQVSIHASASMQFSHNLSCQISAQGLISGLDYEDHRFYQGGLQYSPQEGDYNYDFNYSALNSTMLLRWEYLPGSTLYLVWTRSRPNFDDTINDLDFSRDFNRFFSSGADNLFLIKASYWLNI